MTKKPSRLSMLLIFSAAVYTLLNPFETAYYCSLSLRLCINSLIPSLFIFMVLSRILASFSSQGVFQGRLTHALSSFLNLPEQLIPVCIFGMFSGAPSGAFAISDIYRKGICTKSEAERACILSNNCSASFILGFAGGQFSNRKAGLFILIANLLSTITVYLLLFNKKDISPQRTQETSCDDASFQDTVTRSISEAVTAIINLCGFVLFFYTLSGFICEKAALIPCISDLSFKSQAIIKTAICGTLEMTSGVLCASTIGGNLSAVMTSSICAFCGTSVIMQVGSVLKKSGLSSKPYILSRCLCAILCPIYSAILFLLSDASMTVSKIHASRSDGITLSDVTVLGFITAVSITAGVFIAHLDKKHKNK